MGAGDARAEDQQDEEPAKQTSTVSSLKRRIEQRSEEHGAKEFKEKNEHRFFQRCHAVMRVMLWLHLLVFS